MIRYLLSTDAGEVAVSLRVSDPNQRARIAYDGSADGAEIVRDWLEYEAGAFGHAIGEVTTAIDLGHAMERQPGARMFEPRCTHGEDLLARYDGELGGAIS